MIKQKSSLEAKNDSKLNNNVLVYFYLAQFDQTQEAIVMRKPPIFLTTLFLC